MYLLEAFKVLLIFKKIESLEKDRKYDEAISLRSLWLSKVKHRNSSPLWLSEGKYQLHYKKDYSKALIAFENGMKAHKNQPLHYGSVSPLDIYYGGAVSAVMLNRIQKGEKHFKEFLNYYDCIYSDKDLSSYALSYSDGIKWLREQINTEFHG